MGKENGVDRVDEYLSEVPQPQRATLERLRATLRTVLPDADEDLKYAVPCFVVDGKGVAGYGAFAHHCSYFPMSGSVLGAAGELVAGYTVSKGSLQFPVDATLPVALVRELVRLRLDEVGSA